MTGRGGGFRPTGQLRNSRLAKSRLPLGKRLLQCRHRDRFPFVPVTFSLDLEATPPESILTDMTDASNPRWYRFTAERLILALLVVEGLLWLSERFQWFAFNQHKGWTVLIAVGAVGAAMLLMLLWFTVSLFLRWRFQFSIRSLLVLTVAVAVPCSWLTVEMKKARRQREVVGAVVGSSGCAYYDYETVLYEGSIHKSGSPVIGEPSSPSWLRDLFGQDFFHNVTTVIVYSDNELTSLKELPHLQKVYVVGSQITDGGVQNLEQCIRLQKLYLDGTKVTDTGVKKLQQALPNCKIIR